MAESIIKDLCPNCGATNYINNGDISDLTIPDIDGIRCHSCQYEWVLDPDIIEDNTDPEGLWIEDGVAKLNDK